MIKYQHRQFGKTLVITLGVGVVVCLILSVLIPGSYIALSIALVPFICAILFSSLSIEITDRSLCWKFGPGLIRKQVLLSKVNDAKVT